MYKIIYIVAFLNSILLAESLLGEVQENGVIIRDKDNKKIHVQRELSPLCTTKMINPKALFSDEFAGRRVPDICKKTFVTKIGVLQPMSLGKGIKTVGELEVLLHIKSVDKNPKEYILLDTRTKNWFKQMKIPLAVNLPFNEINYLEESDEDDFDTFDEFKVYQQQLKKLLGLLNIKETKEGLDFSTAKLLMVYCNGTWCSQSPNAIYRLINLGYPREKILWYRGGMQDWLIYDYTVIKGNS